MRVRYEPVVITNVIVAILVALSINLTAGQVGLLTQAVAVVIPVVGGLVARVYTRSEASLADEAEQASDG